MSTFNELTLIVTNVNLLLIFIHYVFKLTKRWQSKSVSTNKTLFREKVCTDLHKLAEFKVELFTKIELAEIRRQESIKEMHDILDLLKAMKNSNADFKNDVISKIESAENLTKQNDKEVRMFFEFIKKEKIEDEKKFSKKISEMKDCINRMTMVIAEYQLTHQNQTIRYHNSVVFIEKINEEIQKIKQYAMKINKLTQESLCE